MNLNTGFSQGERDDAPHEAPAFVPPPVVPAPPPPGAPFSGGPAPRPPESGGYGVPPYGSGPPYDAPAPKRHRGRTVLVVLGVVFALGWMGAHSPPPDPGASRTPRSGGPGASASNAGGAGDASGTTDPMQAFAPAGSELSDDPLDRDSLQRRVVARGELGNLSLRALCISAAKIFAFHGYVFDRPALQNYFDGLSWYRRGAKVSEDDLSDLERCNLQTIRSVELVRFRYGARTWDRDGRAYGTARDPLAEYAPPDSGLSDDPLALDTLQNREVTDQDLADRSLRALSLSYNAIYAAHNAPFRRPSLQRYFRGQAGYTPDPAFRVSSFSPTEAANLKAIRDYERSRFGF